MTREGADGEAEGLTYAAAGVDIERSEAATAALVGAIGELVPGEYAGLVDLGERYLALTTDGVGTKLLVAEAMGEYGTIGIDCVAMNVNDLVAAGVDPVAFVDYLAVDAPDPGLAEDVGAGLARGAERAGVHLVGGETAVMPEVVDGFDLAGACAGLTPKDAVFDGEARPGDVLVGFPSSGIHSNGLTLARRALERAHDLDDPLPGGEPSDDADGDGESTTTIGEALLEPTRIYTDLLEPMRAAGVHAAAHLTGGGWTNLERLGDHRYVVTEPFEPQPVFAAIADAGAVADEEMYRTFNMGTGFVAALPASRAEALVEATDGRVVGRVEAGGGVRVAGLEL